MQKIAKNAKKTNKKFALTSDAKMSSILEKKRNGDAQENVDSNVFPPSKCTNVAKKVKKFSVHFLL